MAETICMCLLIYPSLSSTRDLWFSKRTFPKNVFKLIKELRHSLVLFRVVQGHLEYVRQEKKSEVPKLKAVLYAELIN